MEGVGLGPTLSHTGRVQTVTTQSKGTETGTGEQRALTPNRRAHKDQHPHLSFQLPVFDGPIVGHDLKPWRPPLELHLPVQHG